MPHPMQRKEDKSALGKVNWFIDSYKPLVLLAYGLLLLLGARFIWPRDTLTDHEKRISALEKSSKTTNDNIAVLVRLRCFDKDVSSGERELAGLDCSKMYEAKADDEMRATP